ncbi:hypothetical protein ABIB40_003460 [Pedobacter sp. UYP30]|uniref:hypothetical protein n=1 Tax=Pedobacter sp. UYP30 TaxID=1756400 RepID=UPI00339403CB
MPKLKINLFGELWKLSHLELTKAEYDCIKLRASEMNLPLTEALLDISFYDSHLFSGSFRQKTIEGLLNSYKNQIEIWFGGKKVQKIKMIDLNADFLLFPLFNTCETKLLYKEFEPGIYIEQREVGLVGSYEKVIDRFSLTQLEFFITEMEIKIGSIEILTEIKYCNESLKIKNSDTLITQQLCYKM